MKTKQIIESSIEFPCELDLIKDEIRIDKRYLHEKIKIIWDKD